MPSSLPSNSEDFLEHNLTNIDASNLALLDECYICHEELGTNHPASQITGIPDCSHVFGHDCLVAWISSSNVNNNTCPMCRTILYTKALPSVDEIVRLTASLRRLVARMETLEGMVDTATRLGEEGREERRQQRRTAQRTEGELQRQIEELQRQGQEARRTEGEARRGAQEIREVGRTLLLEVARLRQQRDADLD
ncbi:uncharacterized protein BDZ99DRAFT_457020 [Mytilinidion resinicola]|uniref:RING-type domain-containing protein n=1 Tax=Mytilinidion resinicola TaxID=574789 RepID=A0A6A6Z8C1_9PEZI|nr:uncharacterized protein BDZ99DRAFT_457020 [Mytilinidion resinicola]KAF2817266.1 hypothetical protein BDZ99DRAFT_457020 [Mytilinidion resinicola]